VQVSAVVCHSSQLSPHFVHRSGAESSSAYPGGHPASQRSLWSTFPASHDRHFAVASSQVTQLSSHFTQTVGLAAVLVYPVGQLSVQVLAPVSKVVPVRQLVQWLGSPFPHVPQFTLHTVQTPATSTVTSDGHPS
jgi:hypothetical protein